MRRQLLYIMLMLPILVHAQDVATVEALIHDHNKISSILLTRSAIEQLNGVLHEASSVTSVDYKDVNANLDRYTHCFNVIDDIVNTGATAFHFRNTYNTVKERIDGYTALLDRYKQFCLSHGDILSTDTIIYYTSQDAILAITDEVDNLLGSLTMMASYAVSKTPCTHETMMLNLGSINESLEGIVRIVNHAYFRLWKYIMVRTGYNKSSVQRGKTLRQMADEAFDRWMRSAHGIDY